MSVTKIPDDLLESGVGTSSNNLLKLDSSGNLGITGTVTADGLTIVDRIDQRWPSGVAHTNLHNAIVGVTNGFQTTQDASNNLTYTFNTGANATALKITSTGNVGIGTSSPSQKLTVSGNIDLPNVNSYIFGNGHNVLQVDAAKTYFYGGTGGVQFRTADNTSELVSIDNSGIVTTPNQPAFLARSSSTAGFDCTVNSYTVPYGTNGIIMNTGNHFDTSTYQFNAPVTGVYSFTANARVDSFSGAYLYLDLVVGGNVRSRDLNQTTGSYVQRFVAATVYMAANDTAYCTLRNSGDSSITVNADSWFSGHLVG